MLLSKNKLAIIGTALVLAFLFMGKEAVAQREVYLEDDPSLKERTFFGGNFSLQFGSLTFIDISPLAGVMLTEKLSTGLSATYQYLNFRYASSPSSVYGGRVFGRYNITRNIFAHTEFESLNTAYIEQGPTPADDRLVRDWVNGMFIGGGYFTPFGNRGGANITLLYNLVYDSKRSPYNEPYVIRVGFVF